MTRLNEQQIEIMKDELAVELADWLMETYGYTAAEALDILYTSENFDRLQNSATGFYYTTEGSVASSLRNKVCKITDISARSKEERMKI